MVLAWIYELREIMGAWTQSIGNKTQCKKKNNIKKIVQHGAKLD